MIREKTKLGGLCPGKPGVVNPNFVSLISGCISHPATHELESEFLVNFLGKLASPAITTQKGRGFVRAMYLPRIMGFALGALSIGGGLQQHRAPDWLYLILILCGLAWPHLAYLLASRRNRPIAAEYQNLRLDALLCGLWLPMIGFNLAPSVITTVIISMNSAMVGGARLLAQSLLTLAAGRCNHPDFCWLPPDADFRTADAALLRAVAGHLSGDGRNAGRRGAQPRRAQCGV